MLVQNRAPTRACCAGCRTRLRRAPAARRTTRRPRSCRHPLLGEADEVGRVARPYLGLGAALGESLEREFADRLQHPEAVARVAQRGSCRRATGGRRGRRRRRLRPRRGCSRRRRRRGGRRAACSSSVSRSCDHSIVARRVCWRGSASRPPLSRSSRWPSRSRICAGVRTRVRAAASSTASGRSSSRRQSSAIVSSGSSRDALAEELDRLRLGERRHRVLDLAADPQQLPARDQELQVGAGLEQLRELGRRLDHLLEVVEQQQELALADVLGEAVLRPQRLRDRLGHERRVAQRGQADPEDARLERGHELGGDLEREPRLARTARARRG